jgi:uncharacterized membrane protein
MRVTWDGAWKGVLIETFALDVRNACWFSLCDFALYRLDKRYGSCISSSVGNVVTTDSALKRF